MCGRLGGSEGAWLGRGQELQSRCLLRKILACVQDTWSAETLRVGSTSMEQAELHRNDLRLAYLSHNFSLLAYPESPNSHGVKDLAI